MKEHQHAAEAETTQETTQNCSRNYPRNATTQGNVIIVTGEVTGEVTGQVAGEVLGCCWSAVVIEKTVSGKPNSRLQKYRITAKGASMQKSLQRRKST